MVVELVALAASGERRLKMTYEEYLALPTEGLHAEWVRGEVIIFMPPTMLHQDVSNLLASILRFIVDEHEFGRVFDAPCEMYLPDQQAARQPDIFFVAAANVDRIQERRLIGPADLVIEIISESTERYDRRDKFREYAEAGVPEYWLFDVRPGRRPIEPYTLVDGRYEPIQPDDLGRYRSIVLPVFWFDPDWLRRSPLPRLTILLRQIVPEAF